MPEKIAHLEDSRSHIEQSRSGVSAQFVARLCSVFNPPRNPFRMPAIDSIVPFSPICAWHEVAISAERLEPKYFLENIWSNRHPTFTAFRKKVFFGPIHNSYAAVVNPVRARVHDFDVS
jgi:hypothetical protein